MVSAEAATDRRRPRVSIVIPAFQAAATIERALDSLKAQTFADWEAIVVDDGSSDDTFQRAQAVAAGEPRITALRQDNKGASAARNRGLAIARGRWVGFLDSDDWFDPRFLEVLLQLSEKNPASGVVYCDFAFAYDDGRILAQPQVPDLAEPFPILASSCVLSVHCALIRADLLERTGLFDETLATNEDWDLWQRIARLDPGFVGVRDFLAFYYCRPKSLSRQPLLLATDGMTAIDRMFGPDPRVKGASPRYAEGLPLEDRPNLRLNFILGCAGGALAAGGDGVELIPLAAVADKAILHAEDAAEGLLGGLAFGRCCDVPALAGEWEDIEPRLDRFWTALGKTIGQARAVETARFVCRLKVLGAAAFDRPFVSDAVAIRRIDLSKPVPDLDPEGCDSLIVGVFKDEALLGRLELPAEGVMRGEDVRAALLAEAPHWPQRKLLLRKLGAARSVRFWKRVLARALRARGWGVRQRLREPKQALLGATLAVRLILVQALRDLLEATVVAARPSAPPAPADVPPPPETTVEELEQQGPPETNTVEYWDKMFDRPDPWSYDSGYEQTKYRYTLDLVGRDRPERALELACAEGHFTVQLAGKVGSLLATDISGMALARAAARCVGRPNVAFEQLDFFNLPLPGTFDLIVCSEVLYECRSLPKLRAIARNIAEHLEPGGALVSAHAIEVSEERDHSGFDWGGVFGAKTVGEVFTEAGLQIEEQVETELYRVYRFRKGPLKHPPVLRREPIGAPPEPEYAACVCWGGVEVTRSEAEVERAVAVPVLMYHRVAEDGDGPKSLAQYRLSPERFEEQLRWLRRNGYHCVTPEDLAYALEVGRPIAGRPVMLTFDDGYCDFRSEAWPILKRYGMSAAVAVVTDLVGKTASWDSDFGAPPPLMTWDEIAEVHAEGAHVFSHSASHRGFPSLSGREALDEAARSRKAIEDVLGAPPLALVYPYGAFDPMAAQACWAAGYSLGMGVERGPVTLLSNPMHTPRIDVSGFEDLEAFVDKLTRVDQRTGKLRPGAAP